MSELAKRVLVAVIALPLFLVVIYLGDIYFAITICAIASVALWEFYRLAEKKGYAVSKELGLVLGVLIIAVAYATHISSLPTMKIVIVICFLLILFSFLVSLFSKNKNMLANMGMMLTGVIYVSVPFAMLVFMRLSNESGLVLIYTIFIAIWSCDTMAYFIGRKFGKRPLMKSVSPNKTIAGAIGGLFGAVAGAVVFVTIVSWSFNSMTTSILANTIVVGLICGIFGQLGDLIESKLKRDANVKDSSHLIPGHGGMLDRFDSVIFAVPFVMIFNSI